MKTFKHTGVFVLAILTFWTCNKQDETLDLNSGYHFVADLMEYCRGTCDETDPWENKATHVKGHIRDIENNSIVQSYYENSRFYLEDIRNGMFMEIRVVSSKDEVFDKIRQARKADRFYIRGIAVSVQAQNDGDCTEGVVIELYHDSNLLINAE